MLYHIYLSINPLQFELPYSHLFFFPQIYYKSIDPE
uniref:PHD finger protein 12, Paired-Peptide Complex, Amphipathic Helix motif n=1 Tax=Podoviridae sp. cttxo15 TaxID=2826584 RepID=A0A8S5N1J8_9CAUD|nr:MAG TPA: PHD finger protein 12, Paired-Peptide Complex, Amphipathic Helix motif [Podoviridae sp. cttxo15]